MIIRESQRLLIGCICGALGMRWRNEAIQWSNEELINRENDDRNTIE
jgi:hypothetical protein